LRNRFQKIIECVYTNNQGDIFVLAPVDPFHRTRVEYNIICIELTDEHRVIPPYCIDQHNPRNSSVPPIGQLA